MNPVISYLYTQNTELLFIGLVVAAISIVVALRL